MRSMAAATSSGVESVRIGMRQTPPAAGAFIEHPPPSVSAIAAEHPKVLRVHTAEQYEAHVGTLGRTADMGEALAELEKNPRAETRNPRQDLRVF